MERILLYCYKGMGILDFFYPKFCLGCGFLGTYICPLCFKKLVPVRAHQCLYCKKPSHTGLTHPNCCKKFNVDGSVSLFEYNPLMRKIIKNIKYRLAREILVELTGNIRPRHLGALVRIKSLFSKALIQPVPLSPRKLKLRGFNQAFLIAKYFSSVLGLGIGDFIIRKNGGTAQAALASRLKRQKNVKGVFSLRPRINLKNRTVIIVDDVVTSGATANEAAKILKKAGACRVYLLSLARQRAMI